MQMINDKFKVRKMETTDNHATWKNDNKEF